MSNILDLIPQRPPVVMVDKFIGINGNISETCFLIHENNIFVNNGIFSECGLIEHIAQSAAARMGFIYKSRNQPVPIGYIGSVNDFVITHNPRVGDEISTTIEIIQDIFKITLIQAYCYVNENKIASCRMKIFLDS